ncbi:MAG: polyhydroxyalkanoate synthesis regulator DNA-binding domain-containing protein [Bellilinea sp.]
MPTIRRYTNRKLYDLDSRRYVTLEEIGAMVRGGDEVQVVDYATGADLTNATLLQVLFDEERRAADLLPQALLTRLVNRGSRGLNAMLNPLAAFDGELRRRVARLVELGQLTPDEADRLCALLLDPALTTVEMPAEATAPPASAADIQSLLAEVERLEKRIEQLAE